MPEEIRFYLRTALFTIVLASVYWFVSYEETGTILLAGIVVGASVFVTMIALRVGASRPGGRGLKTLLGFGETGSEVPLGLDEDLFPTSSAWPLAASIAAMLIGVGLIYGAWLWIPGAAIALATTWGWLAE